MKPKVRIKKLVMVEVWDEGSNRGMCKKERNGKKTEKRSRREYRIMVIGDKKQIESWQLLILQSI